jgi:hypothetical protein
MTVTIDLSNSRLDLLRSQAARQGVSVEEHVQAIIALYVDTTSDRPAGIAGDPEFRAAMRASFQENTELYRRLAK